MTESSGSTWPELPSTGPRTRLPAAVRAPATLLNGAKSAGSGRLSTEAVAIAVSGADDGAHRHDSEPATCPRTLYTPNTASQWSRVRGRNTMLRSRVMPMVAEDSIEY